MCHRISGPGAALNQWSTGSWWISIQLPGHPSEITLRCTVHFPELTSGISHGGNHLTYCTFFGCPPCPLSFLLFPYQCFMLSSSKWTICNSVLISGSASGGTQTRKTVLPSKKSTTIRNSEPFFNSLFSEPLLPSFSYKSTCFLPNAEKMNKEILTLV